MIYVIFILIKQPLSTPVSYVNIRICYAPPTSFVTHVYVVGRYKEIKKKDKQHRHNELTKNNASSSIITGVVFTSCNCSNRYNIKLLFIMMMSPSANSLYASTAFSGRGLSQRVHLFPDTLPLC